MSAKAISEKSGKVLLAAAGVIGAAHVVSVKADTKYDELLQANPWLQTQVWDVFPDRVKTHSLDVSSTSSTLSSVNHRHLAILHCKSGLKIAATMPAHRYR